MANATARSLRRKMTRQEVKLWVQLRALKELGYHFRKQSPIPPYIVDFECRRAKLVIEVDGSQHGESSGQIRDRARDLHLHKAGYRVLRFWNNQVDRELEGVMAMILQVGKSNPHPARP